MKLYKITNLKLLQHGYTSPEFRDEMFLCLNDNDNIEEHLQMMFGGYYNIEGFDWIEIDNFYYSKRCMGQEEILGYLDKIQNLLN